jgi:hypothetical protein
VFIKGILKSNLVNQEYGPSLKLSVIKDLDQSHPTGKVFVNLERGLRLKTIVTGKLLEPVGLLMDFLLNMVSY